MFAFPRIEQVPCAAPFDPREQAILNTGIVFGPRDELAEFPFDVLVISRIYSFYYILALRRSFMNKLRSDIYPTCVGELPWSAELAGIAAELNALRDSFFEVCRRRYEQEQSRAAAVDAIGLEPLRTVYRALTTQPLVFSSTFDDVASFTLEVGRVAPSEGGFTIPLSDDGHAIIVPTEPIARLLSAGLRLYETEDYARSKLLLAPVPPNEDVSALLSDIIESFATDRLDSAVDQELDKIDLLVGETLGLSSEQIRFIAREMAEDPFLSRIRPRYPYFTPRLQGRRMRLESAARYLGQTA